ncbi:NUDIX hydrolase, partial [Gardnerella vaginalis]
KGETVNYKWVDEKSLLEMSQDELVSSRAIKLIKTVDI